jgi:hypothetical protein
LYFIKRGGLEAILLSADSDRASRDRDGADWAARSSADGALVAIDRRRFAAIASRLWLWRIGKDTLRSMIGLASTPRERARHARAEYEAIAVRFVDELTHLVALGRKLLSDAPHCGSSSRRGRVP